MQKKIKKRLKKENLLRIFSKTLAFLFLVLFISFFVFLLTEATKIGPDFAKSLFNLEFNLGNKQAGIWFPLLVSFIVSIGALIIASYIGVRTSFFLVYRCKPKIRKKLSLIIDILSGIPSVIFGLFASQILSIFFRDILKLPPLSLLNVIAMLSFMIIPIVISLTTNTLTYVNNDLISVVVSLGENKTSAIYKIIKKEIKPQLTVILTLAFARTISETMAVNFVLQSVNYQEVINNNRFFTSDLKTLGSVISTFIFSENGDEQINGVLYIFGIIILILVSLLNFFAIWSANPKTLERYPFLKKISNFIYQVVWFIPNNISALFVDLTSTRQSVKKIKVNNINERSLFFKERLQSVVWIKLNYFLKIFQELICTFLAFGFVLAILLFVFINGSVAINNNGSTVFSFEADSTGRALVNTLVIILITITITFPLALLIAIWLNEYNNSKVVKNVFNFVIDSLSSMPSIIYGLFGLSFFLRVLQLSAGGANGTSLIAGILTISVVILPFLIRTCQQALNNVSWDLRISAFALGISKREVIFKIVLPSALKGLIIALILSINRIIAETAPFFITSGLSSSNLFHLSLPGQTLTTRIYGQLFSINSNAISVMLETSLVSVVFLILLIFFSSYLIPSLFLLNKQKWLVIKSKFQSFKLWKRT
ncbi:phosphate ABC transporter permease PstA [Mycoplasmoides genitalium]